MFNFLKKDKYRVRAITWGKDGYGDTSHHSYFKTLEDATKDFEKTVEMHTYKGWEQVWSGPHNVTIIAPKGKEKNTVELITLHKE